MPWYNLGVMTAYLDIGADIATPDNLPDGNNGPLYMWINPYVRKSIGPGAIRAGIMVGINNSGVKDADPVITLQIPVQFTYSF
jgi:hypothetical protein